MELKEANTIEITNDKSTGSKNKSYLALTATSIIWGTTWVASKIGVEKVPGLEVSYIRQFLAGMLLVIFFLIKGEKLPTLLQFRWIIVISVFMFVLANGLSTWSIKYIPSGLAALIGAMYPLCVVIIDMIYFKTNSNTPLTFIGLLLGFAGIVVVFYENAFHVQTTDYTFGIVMGLIAMMAWSIGTIFIARNKYKMNPYYAVGWQMFIGSFIIYILAYFTHNIIPIADIPFQTWAAIGYLIVFGSIVAFIAFIYSIKYLPQAVASLYAYINPLVAMLVGSLLLHEPLTFNIFIGAIITLAGVYLVNLSIKKK
jgi:drug/metabolite transporter (DMT)-like permease